jgi:hypothetical protein
MQNPFVGKVENAVDAWFSSPESKKFDSLAVFVTAGFALGLLVPVSPILWFVAWVPLGYTAVFAAWKFSRKPKKPLAEPVFTGKPLF